VIDAILARVKGYAPAATALLRYIFTVPEQESSYPVPAGTLKFNATVLTPAGIVGVAVAITVPPELMSCIVLAPAVEASTTTLMRVKLLSASKTK
jgi:hypothetical protein